jgi:hypothetical protein
VVTEEAVPGGGERASQSQCKSKWRGLVKREEAGCDTVTRDWQGRERRGERGQTSECVGMWVHGLDSRGSKRDELTEN